MNVQFRIILVAVLPSRDMLGVSKAYGREAFEDPLNACLALPLPSDTNNVLPSPRGKEGGTAGLRHARCPDRFRWPMRYLRPCPFAAAAATVT